MNVTRGGLPCQTWTAQSPHKHSRTPSDYPNSGLGDHNYCRNPDQTSFAWCYTMDTNVCWDYCNVGLPQVSCETPDCQKGPAGDGYRGDISYTVSGITCQQWTSQFPHEHTRTPENYPSSGLGAHNHCRNVGNTSFTAWCYTTDSQVRWEYCPVGDFDPACAISEHGS